MLIPVSILAPQKDDAGFLSIHPSEFKRYSSFNLISLSSIDINPSLLLIVTLLKTLGEFGVTVPITAPYSFSFTLLTGVNVTPSSTS